MKRRQLVTGFGALIGGSSILMGSGAFTSVEADRDASVEVAKEDKAYLRIFPTSNPTNGSFAHTSSGTKGNKLQLDFNDEIDNDVNSLGGDGVGQNSEYEFDDVFRIENQGTQPVYINISGITTHGGNTSVQFYVRDEHDNKYFINDGGNDAKIGIGTTVNIGVHIETADQSQYAYPPDDDSGTATIMANSNSNDNTVVPQ